MKNWFKIILPLMFLLLLCAQAAGEGEENILGVWKGSYPAAEKGPDGNALTRETTIRIWSLNKDTGEFYGIMEYRIPGSMGNLYGSYYFKGQLNIRWIPRIPFRDTGCWWMTDTITTTVSQSIRGNMKAAKCFRRPLTLF